MMMSCWTRRADTDRSWSFEGREWLLSRERFDFQTLVCWQEQVRCVSVWIFDATRSTWKRHGRCARVGWIGIALFWGEPLLRHNRRLTWGWDKSGHFWVCSRIASFGNLRSGNFGFAFCVFSLGLGWIFRNSSFHCVFAFRLVCDLEFFNRNFERLVAGRKMFTHSTRFYGKAEIYL